MELLQDGGFLAEISRLPGVGEDALAGRAPGDGGRAPTVGDGGRAPTVGDGGPAGVAAPAALSIFYA
jgi:hypothetical protein